MSGFFQNFWTRAFLSWLGKTDPTIPLNGQLRISKRSRSDFIYQLALQHSYVLVGIARGATLLLIAGGCSTALYLRAKPLKSPCTALCSPPNSLSALAFDELRARDLHALMTNWKSPSQVGKHLRILGWNGRPDAALPREFVIQIGDQISLLAENAPFELTHQLGKGWTRSNATADASFKLSAIAGTSKARLASSAKDSAIDHSCQMPIENGRQIPFNVEGVTAWQTSSPTWLGQTASAHHVKAQKGIWLHFAPDAKQGSAIGSYKHLLFVDTWLIWQKGRWRAPKSGEVSRSAPLICLKSIGTDQLTFGLWDTNGGRCELQLQRSREHLDRTCLQLIELIGPRNRSAFTVEIKGRRQVLEVGELLVFDGGIWRRASKANTSSGQLAPLKGIHLQFTALLLRKGQWIAKGRLVSPSGCIAEEVEIGQKWPNPS